MDRNVLTIIIKRFVKMRLIYIITKEYITASFFWHRENFPAGPIAVIQVKIFICIL